MCGDIKLEERKHKAKQAYINYLNGWSNLEGLHKYLFDLCGGNLCEAYNLLLEVSGRK